MKRNRKEKKKKHKKGEKPPGLDQVGYQDIASDDNSQASFKQVGEDPDRIDDNMPQF